MTQTTGTPPSDAPYLHYIAESLSRIEEYLRTPTAEVDRRAFFDDALTRDAVLWRLQKLADAADHLSDGLKRRNAEATWDQIGTVAAMFGDRYFRIDLDRAWDLIECHLPSLRAVVSAEIGGKAVNQ